MESPFTVNIANVRKRGCLVVFVADLAPDGERQLIKFESFLLLMEGPIGARDGTEGVPFGLTIA